jgi:hypothetical protein
MGFPRHFTTRPLDIFGLVKRGKEPRPTGPTRGGTPSPIWKQKPAGCSNPTKRLPSSMMSWRASLPLGTLVRSTASHRSRLGQRSGRSRGLLARAGSGRSPRTVGVNARAMTEPTTWSPVKDHADAGDRAGMTLLPTCPRMAPCPPPSSTLRVGSADGHRPCLTATARDALRAPGRDEETGPRQPNKETWLAMGEDERPGVSSSCRQEVNSGWRWTRRIPAVEPDRNDVFVGVAVSITDRP